MYRKIVALVCILALALSGCVTGNSPKKKQGSFTWNPREELIITASGGRPYLFGRKHLEEMRRVLPEIHGLRTSLSLLYLVKERERQIKSSHTIFMVRPKHFHHLEELEAEYADLLPLLAEKLKLYLKTYSWPLLYFSYDSTGKIRGVIIAKEVTPALAKLLTKKPIPLDTLLQYENRKLKKAEKRQEKVKKTFTWNPKDKRERVIITITGRPRPRGDNYYDEFSEEIRKVVSVVDLWLAPSLLYWEGEKLREDETITKLDIIRSHHSIFIIRPQSLYDFHNLEAKYPDLLPVPTEKLESLVELKGYGATLLYFSLDYTGMLRGVILAWELDPSLAKLLTEKPIPLDTFLEYENGELKELEK